MEITPRFEGVSGTFDMGTGRLTCVPYSKYDEVLLCFKEKMNIPFAKIRLYDSGLLVDAKATYDDAAALGNEITRRWNAFSDIAGGSGKDIPLPAFPVMLRKMWSGAEVQTWIDENIAQPVLAVKSEQTGKQADAERAAFEKGALVALGLLNRIHDKPDMVSDVIRELGLEGRDCRDLDDFDKLNLRKVVDEGRGVSLLGLEVDEKDNIQ